MRDIYKHAVGGRNPGRKEMLYIIERIKCCSAAWNIASKDHGTFVEQRVMHVCTLACTCAWKHTYTHMRLEARSRGDKPVGDTAHER